jgi:hypothetical protein
MTEIFEACCRCRWWDATDEQRADAHFADYNLCYGHSMDMDGDWQITQRDERCPHFLALPGPHGLYTDVCPGCQVTASSLQTIVQKVEELRYAHDAREEVNEVYMDRVRRTIAQVTQLADVILYGRREEQEQ